MKNVLVINPNSSQDTTDMMVRIAQAEAGEGIQIFGITARRSPSMIITAEELSAAASEVGEVWRLETQTWAGVIVSAFGDPGIEHVRAEATVPVTGICEASMLEAAEGGRRFGVATVTPELEIPILGRVHDYGLSSLYSGIRLTPGNPRELAADPKLLEAELHVATRDCINLDGALAVVIGGGPLGQAALGLAPLFNVPVIAPISAAMRRMNRLLRV